MDFYIAVEQRKQHIERYQVSTATDQPPIATVFIALGLALFKKRKPRAI